MRPVLLRETDSNPALRNYLYPSFGGDFKNNSSLKKGFEKIKPPTNRENSATFAIYFFEGLCKICDISGLANILLNHGWHGFS